MIAMFRRWYVLNLQNAANSPMSQIQGAALILMGGLLLENGVSFLKSLIVARYYGTSGEFDAYVLALTPYLFLFGMISGVIRATMIPRYVEWRETGGAESAADKLASFTIWLLGILAGIGVALWIGNARIVAHLGKGFTPEQLVLTASLMNISIGLLVLTVVVDLGLALLQAHQRFFLSALIPLIGGLVSLSYLMTFWQQGVFSLLWGLIAAASVQMALVLRGLRPLFPYRRPKIALRHPEMRATGRVMAPLLLGASFGNINMTVDQIMASSLPTGSLSSLHYAIRLHNLSTQMFIMVTSKAVFPFLAKHVAAREFALLKKTFLQTIWRLLLLLLPIMLVIIVGGEWLVRLMLERGAFTPESTTATSRAWIAYTIGLPMQAIGILTARMYNAFQRNAILTWVSGASIGLNILFNLIFMAYWGHVGIALSTSVVYAITTITLVYLLYRSVWRVATAIKVAES